MKRLILALAFAAMVFPESGKTALTPASATSVSATADKFFSLLSAGKADQAYEALLDPKIVQDKKQDVSNLVTQTENLVSLYGNISGWERIQEDQISPYYLIVVYEVRFRYLPVFFRMRFYHADASTPWSVSNILFNDDPDKILN